MSDTSPPTSAPPPAPTDSSPPPDSSSPPPEPPSASPPASPPSNPTPPPASPPTSPPPATPPPASPPQAPSPPPPSPTPASPPPGSPPPAAPPPGNPPAPPTPPPPKSTPPPPSNRSPPPPSVPSPPSPPGTPSSPPPPSYLSPPPPYEPPPPASPSSSSSPSAGLIAGIAAGAVIGAAVLLGILFLIFKKRPRRRDEYESFRGFYGPSPSPSRSAERYRPGQVQTSIFHSQQPPPSSPSWKVNNSAGSGSGSGHKPGFSPKNPPLSSVPPPAVAGGPFKYEDLESATNGFSDSNVLGQGGFGLVYKGVLSGKEVAIKKLKSGGGQGDREFRAEVEIISRVHHRNLVSLVGFCIHEDQRLLVYEYVPNKTLDFHLHGSGRPTLDWLRRWKIALGAAKGFAYLHEDCDPKIIHRDIKAANILLDYNFEPKVADFGLAKFVPTNMSHVSTRVMGTFGYVAPEYANSGKLTDRSDVYSYGVVLLELITGRKPVMASDPHMDQSLVNWARPLLSRAMTEEIYDQLIDPWLETNYDQYDMTRLIHCAAAAVRHSGKKRPRMGQIVRYLEGEISLEDLNAGMMPGNSEVKGNSTEQEALRRMAFGGIITEDYAESDRTSEYEQTSSSGGVNTEEIELRRINTKERSGEV